MDTIQWVFSGIGVLILSLLIKYLIKTKKNKGQKANNTQNINMANSNNNTFQIIEHQEQHVYQAKQEESETLMVTDISPIEIKDAIKNAPSTKCNSPILCWVKRNLDIETISYF